jgi:hypothetical protein
MFKTSRIIGISLPKYFRIVIKMYIDIKTEPKVIKNIKFFFIYNPRQNTWHRLINIII